MTSARTIENDHLRVQVYSGYGGKIASVIDKHDRFELMFSYPLELPTCPHYDIDYGEGWYAGWDECFPGIGKGPYPLHPYRDITIPDHGELWGVPTQVKPSSEGILTCWHGIRFGYHFSRHLRLIDNTLEAQYTLENLVPFDFHFVWALHSLMRLTASVELQYEGDRLWRLSHGAVGDAVNAGFSWPLCAADEDLSRLHKLPAGRGWKAFSVEPISKPLVIDYPERKRKLAISYESSCGIEAYWGIWINTGGWAGHHHFAVEPTTGRYDRLDAAVKDRSAAKVDPLSTTSWTVRWTVG